MATVNSLVDIGRSLREGFFMFWETLWPLILGFGFSGVVQAFVSHRSIERQLGDHRAASVARASGFGVLSSSCSYAATALAKTLFLKGADFVSSIVFMFASTNLVVELGIVLVVLIGWQFAVSEFVGGIIMIVLLAFFGSLWLTSRYVSEARSRASDPRGAHGHDHVHGPPMSAQPDKRVWSREGWSAAATYTMADLTMLRRELAIGYTVAGFLAVAVPASFWSSAFISGHGVWTSVENAVVGPFIAIVSCVCSVGNVPLAAALWKGGISFGGVVSFIFADLISFPLLMVFRRYYGTRVMVRMLALFWVVMSVAGIATEGIFRAAGLVPRTRPTQIAPDHFALDYTTYLNVVFLAAFGLLYWLYRTRNRSEVGLTTSVSRAVET